jgi:hypothetical protein
MMNQSPQQAGDTSGAYGVVVQRYYGSINKPLRIERVTEVVDLGVLVSSSAAIGAYGFGFSAADTTGFSSLSAAFDQYRIVSIECIFKPLNSLNVPATSDTGVVLIAAVDFDTASAPAAFTTLAQYDKQLRILLGQGQAGVLAFRPNPLLTFPSAGGDSAILPPTDSWIDSGDGTVNYAGLRVIVTQAPSSALTRWRLFAEYTIEYRSRS